MNFVHVAECTEMFNRHKPDFLAQRKQLFLLITSDHAYLVATIRLHVLEIIDVMCMPLHVWRAALGDCIVKGPCAMPLTHVVLVHD